ncbi:hypothetical protein C8Q75DRAFT_810659 [Abortiporus biennis]|nr:hypothetical protein C8Q75DRAFT_810659 [Abortiporus biennis]
MEQHENDTVGIPHESNNLTPEEVEGLAIQSIEPLMDETPEKDQLHTVKVPHSRYHQLLAPQVSYNEPAEFLSSNPELAITKYRIAFRRRPKSSSYMVRVHQMPEKLKYRVSNGVVIEESYPKNYHKKEDDNVNQVRSPRCGRTPIIPQSPRIRFQAMSPMPSFLSPRLHSQPLLLPSSRSPRLTYIQREPQPQVQDIHANATSTPVKDGPKKIQFERMPLQDIDVNVFINPQNDDQYLRSHSYSSFNNQSPLYSQDYFMSPSFNASPQPIQYPFSRSTIQQPSTPLSPEISGLGYLDQAIRSMNFALALNGGSFSSNINTQQGGLSSSPTTFNSFRTVISNTRLQGQDSRYPTYNNDNNNLEGDSDPFNSPFRGIAPIDYMGSSCKTPIARPSIAELRKTVANKTMATSGAGTIGELAPPWPPVLSSNTSQTRQ